jgi:repressor LexA
MEMYFKVTAPSVHQMIVNLEKRGFISRTPGQGRSIELRLSREQLPDLE